MSNREGELKNLVEAINPKIRETVSKNKEKQANSQDKNSNIRKDLLPKGTIVLLKNDGLLSKLESRFTGPYIIDGISKLKNYYLRDKTGFVLESAIPLNKLKIINETDLVQNEL